MSLASSISSIYSNIFKSKKNHSVLNNNNTNKYINYDKIDGNIIKTFFKREQFDLELYTNIKLNEMNLNILPEILFIEDNDTFSTIKYNTNNLLSLRDILEKKNNFNYIINELVSFIKTIKNNKIIIGNLHIDNIYVNLKSMEFFIIDLINVNFNKDESNLDFQSLSLSLNSDYFNYKTSIFTKHTSQDTFISNLIELYM